VDGPRDGAAGIAELRDAIEGPVRQDASLWKHTTIRIGGPARVYVRPAGIDDLRRALQWARRNDLPYAVLGGGSNVLVSDGGYAGLVVHMTGLFGRRMEGTRLRIAAGEKLAGVAWWATRLGLSGLEWACGIPGTIGGAVVMNAGTKAGDTSNVLESVEILTKDGSIERRPVASLRLGYRTSSLLTDDLQGVVVGVTLALQRDEPADCVERARASIEDRMSRLPVGASAGCIFRNPVTGPTAGELLDRAGCKSARVGSARVSDRHANVIVNEGTNNAGDVLELIERMKHRVADAFGVELHEEVVRLD